MKILLHRSVCLILLLLSWKIQYAQPDLSQQILQVDPKVRIGTLDNGFTYYIRTNHKPEKRVEMRLAVNAGSVLENEDQQGLAHFVEHMCFNGTEHFEKNELKNYLESIGMRFGADMNAYTSFDETVYMLTIPSDSLEQLEKGFLVMEDWAHRVTFEDYEIDKERGVIVEEWRIGQGFRQRLRDKYYPVVFKDSRYAVRIPIGKKEIIENCSYETLRNFYRDWYRPDLMALVVVGDIDPDYAEKKIIEHFSQLKNPEIIREREIFQVPDQPGVAVSIVTDKEAPSSLIYTLYKTDVLEETTHADYLEALKYSFITGMLNKRLYELSEQENPPFIGASFFYGSLGARTKDALQGYAQVGDNEIETGLTTLLLETERAYRFGFTQGEFERFKLDLLDQYENLFNEREKTESKLFASEYVRNFLTREPIPGIEFEYEFVRNHINSIDLEDINELITKIISNDNRVIVICAPEKPDITVPSEEDILKIVTQAKQTDIIPYKDKSVGISLLNDLPKAGKIKKMIKLDSIQAVEYDLSNGARVILKPTNFKDDEVLLTAFSMGGHSVYSDSDHFTAMNADGIIQESGVDSFSNSDLDKILAGKSIYVAPIISYESEQIVAECKTSDLEEMFQLLYLYCTDPRINKPAFNSYISKKKDLYENMAKDPQNYFYDQYYRFKAQNHPRGDYLPLPGDWDNVRFERAIEIYKDRFIDAGGFTYILVGSFSIDSVIPLVRTYIGGLPRIKREETYIDLGIRPPNKKEIHNVYKGNDPKSLALLYFEKEIPWNARDAFMISILATILDIRYVDILREKMSGVYSVRAKASMQKIPYSCSNLMITIPCAPENVDTLVHAAVDVIAEIQEHGVDSLTIAKAKEIRRRQLEVSKKTNRFWLNSIKSAIMNDQGLGNVTHDEYIDQVSTDEIQRVARQYFDVNNYLQVVLFPETLNTPIQQ